MRIRPQIEALEERALCDASPLIAQAQQTLAQLGIVMPTAPATTANVQQANLILLRAIESVPAKVSAILAKDVQLVSRSGFDPTVLLPLIGGQSGVVFAFEEIDKDLLLGANGFAGPQVQSETLGVVLSPWFDGGFPGFDQLLAL